MQGEPPRLDRICMNQSWGIARANGVFGLTNIIDDDVLLHSALHLGVKRLIVGQSTLTVCIENKMQEAANPAFQELERLPSAPRTELCSASPISISSRKDKADLGLFR